MMTIYLEIICCVWRCARVEMTRVRFLCWRINCDLCRYSRLIYLHYGLTIPAQHSPPDLGPAAHNFQLPKLLSKEESRNQLVPWNQKWKFPRKKIVKIQIRCLLKTKRFSHSNQWLLFSAKTLNTFKRPWDKNSS